MLQVNLFDQNFSHVRSSIGYDASCFTKPIHGEWVRNQMAWSGHTVFTDEMCFSDVVDSVKSRYKIAWLMESPGVKPLIYQNFYSIQRKFDKVFTFLDFGVASSIGIQREKYVNCCLGGSWVEPEHKRVEKSKLCSLIASAKKDLPGHRLRHEIARSYDFIDLYGTAYKKIESKSEALTKYAFSVVVENVSVPGYFTEKLIDCMLARAVPIYYGDPKIESFFEKRGILSVKDIDDLSFDRYNSMVESVEKNFEIALSFKSSDDNVFKKITETF